jgi:hypothetical protein
MPNTYSLWMDQPVVLQVATGDSCVSLSGIVVGESEGAVRFRVGEGWDIDIYKPMILAVARDTWAEIFVERGAERNSEF